MVETIPKTVRDLWEKWNIRGLVILSLTLQSILVFFAPSRKRTDTKLFVILIWFAYLLADWSAAYAVGQISDSKGDDAASTKPELLAFWAPFLLLHLGGPDSITALALEDNELWRRHLFGLVSQAIATLYVFLLSLPNKLLAPTTLMLVSGVIKFVERTRALYKASSEKFKGSILRKSVKLRRKGAKKGIGTEIITIEEDTVHVPVRPNTELTDLQVVQYAYKFFSISKRLVVDLRFTSQQSDQSKKYFDSLYPEEALRILEVELSFMYDSLFTKSNILHSRVGALFRCIALGSLASSLCIFIKKNKDIYDRFDVILTYGLLIGGIVLDSFAVFMFCVSDWTIAISRKQKENPVEEETWADKCVNQILGFRKLKWKRCRCLPEENRIEGHEVLDRKFMFRRWSEYVHGFNLISFCLGVSPKRIHHSNGCIRNLFDLIINRPLVFPIKVIFSCFLAIEGGIVTQQTLCCLCNRLPSLLNCLLSPLWLLYIFCSVIFDLLVFWIEHLLEFFGVKDQMVEIIFKSSNRLTKDLWKFIFEEVKHKSRVAADKERTKIISSARGDWTLRQHWNGDIEIDPSRLLQYVTKVDYGQSIVLWHIATELIYEKETATEDNFSDREFSKTLSDYMMYLLVMRPALLSAIAGTGMVKFTKTCSVARKFFKECIKGTKNARAACDALLSQKRNMMIFFLVNDESTLDDACRLAEELRRMERRGEDIWGLVSRVWVEILCYAANHCDSKQHTALLSNGGELVCFVWLLMAHFGIGK